jgi:hypothetical protein
MTLQMLPIAQIGSMLSTNQWTEELPHSTDTGKADVTPYTPYLPPHDHYHVGFAGETKALAYMHTSARIPFNHSADVVSPPPDFRA